MPAGTIAGLSQLQPLKNPSLKSPARAFWGCDFATKPRENMHDQQNQDAAAALLIDPELNHEEAAQAGAYLRRAARRYRSHLWTNSGREYYRNKAGRCEDAPCCGCCNA